MESEVGRLIAKVQVSEVGLNPKDQKFVPQAHLFPRQDSNLRLSLRRALPYMPLGWVNAFHGAASGHHRGGRRVRRCANPGLLCGSGALDRAARATAAPITMVMVAARESQ